jgi:hypothetical protein
MTKKTLQVTSSYRQAIATKYHGPTDTRGSRISAKAQAGRVSVPYDHALPVRTNHEAAARALAEKLGWVGKLVGGGNPEGTGDVFVFVD